MSVWLNTSVLTFVQFINEGRKKRRPTRQDLPKDPGHPGIKPLDWKDVGKTKINSKN